MEDDCKGRLRGVATVDSKEEEGDWADISLTAPSGFPQRHSPQSFKVWILFLGPPLSLMNRFELRAGQFPKHCCMTYWPLKWVRIRRINLLFFSDKRYLGKFAVNSSFLCHYPMPIAKWTNCQPRFCPRDILYVLRKIWHKFCYHEYNWRDHYQLNIRFAFFITEISFVKRKSR